MSDAVENLLRNKNLYFSVSGKDYLIKCLNPKHEDNNPSCRVDKITGLTHCFSCGWKTNLFKHFGIFTDNTGVKVARLKTKIKDLRESLVDIEFPEDSIPYNQKHRNISSKTYKKFEAFHTSSVPELEDRIVFPIREVTGKVAMFIGRHVLSEAVPRYKIWPSGRPLPLFPSLLESSTNSIVLVEGMFDMLNLYDKGVHNAVCTFGTSGITDANAATKLLPYKVQGVSKIYVLFDGDKPGREAAAHLKPIIEECGFYVELIDLEDGMDPGMLPQDRITQLKEYIDGR